MDNVNKYLIEAKNWKNDPWGARDELTDRGKKILDRISDNISPSESQFFHNKNKAHIAMIGKQITALQKAVETLEKI